MSAGIPASLKALAVPVDSLFSFEANPRRGDTAQIRASLEAHGQYRPIVVNARDNRVLAGNHTLAQKPLELMARSIANHSGEVYDPFCGSGSTLIAAHDLGRRCYAMEISPAYCDVIAARWEKHTGRKARRPRR